MKLPVQAGTSNIWAMKFSWASTSPFGTPITCPLRSMCIASYPLLVLRAELKDLNPNPGLISLCRKSSFLVRNPEWKPTLPARPSGTFTVVDLLEFVGELNPIGDKPVEAPAP